MTSKLKVLFGKHSGKTYEEVLKEDKKYCEWLLTTKDGAKNKSVIQFIEFIENNINGKPATKKIPVKHPIKKAINTDSDNDSEYSPEVKPVKKKIQVKKAIESEKSDISDISDGSELSEKNKKKQIPKKIPVKDLKAIDTESSKSSNDLPKYKSKNKK
jgi:hypothetical protein